MKKSHTLKHRLTELQNHPPASWSETGVNTRPNLHGLLRYPAMMVPRMQGDIIDAILSTTPGKCHVLDPFVGSGTVMTEALVRNLDFTGIDINPLAALVCEAKASIDRGTDIEGAVQTLLEALRSDTDETIDVNFPGREKWFDDTSALRFSAIRRSIMAVSASAARSVLWVVFAETVRLCSNSRTSTYKLHIRPSDDHVPAEKVTETFEVNLRQTLVRVRDYRKILGDRLTSRPTVRIFCNDVRKAELDWPDSAHQVMVTSPPYGDNQTTIPYGQFSYLALRWIPEEDIPGVGSIKLMQNTNSLDFASLGGTVNGASVKEESARSRSAHFDAFLKDAKRRGKEKSIRKVSTFISDFSDALLHLHTTRASSAHWVLTTGNRTAAGMSVPFDAICRDLLVKMGGKPIASLKRHLPNKRMPSRNSQGAMITTEITTVVEFA